MQKRLKAVALKYSQEENIAPELIAKGNGELAKKILSLAQKHDISIFQNRALVESLFNLELHEEIPPRLYQAVAELFSWLMKVENSTKT